MIRIFFDEIGGGHSDLILKVDSVPSFTHIADSHYVVGLIDGIEPTAKSAVEEYIKQFIDSLKKVSKESSFILFDLSDQYCSGFDIKQGKSGLLNVNYFTIKDIQGWGIGSELLFSSSPPFSNDPTIEEEWTLSKEGVLEGLEWSLHRLNSNT